MIRVFVMETCFGFFNIFGLCLKAKLNLYYEKIANVIFDVSIGFTVSMTKIGYNVKKVRMMMHAFKPGTSFMNSQLLIDIMQSYIKCDKRTDNDMSTDCVLVSYLLVDP
ncbi:hypothetical protein L1887_20930 [Cichorium endivia]|nr:hypothetical protein L1887_20930 [Cichorium endivia]